MRIFVGGSLRLVPRDLPLCREFAVALGREIVQQGHVLLNGCRSLLDKEVAASAQEWLVSNGRDPEESIISYCQTSAPPVHTFGRVRASSLEDWQMNHPDLKVPEQIELSGAAVFVAGGEGTFWAKNWAFYARKPILGIPRFGGAGETIYYQEVARLREISPAAGEEYETLNQLSTNISVYAKEVVDLAVRVVTPRSVFTIMSFKREFRDVFASYRDVCSRFKFEAERTDESTSLERIIPRVESGLRRSAFAIADVTELSPNVFYEVGFARALGKDVILTARKGTQLPFDLGDVPTIFWEDQTDLRESLEKVLASLVVKFGR
jgi:hypothetical protein